MIRVVTAQVFRDELAKDKKGQRAIDAFVDAIQQYVDEDEDDRSVSELMDWAYLESWLLTFEQATKLALKAKTLDECHGILKRASARGQKGRPSTKRVPAIKALVYQKELGWTWPKLRDRFCPCGKAKHDSSCQDSLRAEVVMLKRLLKKYGVSFP